MRKLKTSRSTGRKPHADKAAGWQFQSPAVPRRVGGSRPGRRPAFPGAQRPDPDHHGGLGGASTEAFKASWVDLLRSKYNIDLVIDFRVALRRARSGRWWNWEK